MLKSESIKYCDSSGPHFSEEVSYVGVVCLLREVRDVERRLPGKVDSNLLVVYSFLVFRKRSRDAFLQWSQSLDVYGGGYRAPCP